MTPFYDAMFQMFWNGDRKAMGTRVFYYWQRKFYPIEDEE